MAKTKNPMHAVHSKKKKAGKKGKRNKKVIWFFSILSILLVITLFLLYNQSRRPMSLAKFRSIIPKGFPTIGLDVSHHQGKMDWKFLLDESGFDSLIHFVYCKATEGTTHIDRQWERNRKVLNEMGIPNGAYHFFMPKSLPIPQAQHFLNNWKKRDIDLPPVLDVETEGLSDEDLIAKMEIWLKEIELQTGMRPIIYTSCHFYETKFQNAFKDYKFWIASFTKKPECIDDERIIHWQFTETARIPGTKEKVDLNVSKLVY